MCRYDVRNRLEDKNQFGLKSNLPHRPTAEEVELEEELDYERYLALERDDLRVAEQEGKEREKRRERERERAGGKVAFDPFTYNCIDYIYNSTSTTTPSIQVITR